MKKLRIVLIVLAVVIVFWSGMLITDMVRSQNFSEPVFAKEIRVEADNNKIVYQGLGYTVKTEYFANEYGESYIGGNEVFLFGKLIAAAIT